MPTPAEYQQTVDPRHRPSASDVSGSTSSKNARAVSQYSNNGRTLSTHSARSTHSNRSHSSTPPPGQKPLYSQQSMAPHTQYTYTSHPPPPHGGPVPFPSKSQYRLQRMDTVPVPVPKQTVEDPLYTIFKRADTNNSGLLSRKELSTALVNFDRSPFDDTTVRLMIRMFDTDSSGTIDFGEFQKLWEYIGEWQRLFNQFDADHSGTISYNEFRTALIAIGYNLSDQFTAFFFRTFDKRRNNAISLDLFVRACITMLKITDAFKVYDTDQDGFINISFEQFLTEVMALGYLI
ncbi:EF-hand [Dipodascopsis uninucleata]